MTPPSTSVTDPELVSATTDANEAAEKAAQAQAKALRDRLAKVMDQRVRVSIDGRKMAVPGRLAVAAKDSHPDYPAGHVILHANWGLELDLTAEAITRIETKDVDTGRFVQV